MNATQTPPATLEHDARRLLAGVADWQRRYATPGDRIGVPQDIGMDHARAKAVATALIRAGLMEVKRNGLGYDWAITPAGRAALGRQAGRAS